MALPDSGELSPLPRIIRLSLVNLNFLKDKYQHWNRINLVAFLLQVPGYSVAGLLDG